MSLVLIIDFLFHLALDFVTKVENWLHLNSQIHFIIFTAYPKVHLLQVIQKKGHFKNKHHFPFIQCMFWKTEQPCWEKPTCVLFLSQKQTKQMNIYLLLCSWGLEKAMATHSSVLAWKTPWTEEPGRLQSMGSQWVRNDRVISLSLFTFMHWRMQWQPTPVFLPGESQG